MKIEIPYTPRSVQAYIHQEFDKHRYSLVGMYHDVSAQEFIAPSVDLNHRGQTPEEYFNSHFEKIV